MNQKVIYTSLTNNYDSLKQFAATSPEYDYICFSNDFPPGEKIGIWEIRPIPYSGDNGVRLSRFVKLLPHIALKEYEWSLWLDANIIITDPKFYSFVDKAIDNQWLWTGVPHHKFDCIYDDAREVLRIGRGRYSEIKKQILFLRDNGYPRHAGLFENNIILRRHNDDLIKKIDEEWWNLFNHFSKRDQLSLFFIFHKNQFIPSTLLPDRQCARNSPYIECVNHPKPELTNYISMLFRKVRYRIMLKYIKLFNF